MKAKNSTTETAVGSDKKQPQSARSRQTEAKTAIRELWADNEPAPPTELRHKRPAEAGLVRELLIEIRPLQLLSVSCNAP